MVSTYTEPVQNDLNHRCRMAHKHEIEQNLPLIKRFNVQLE
jgi:hypothetical protein